MVLLHVIEAAPPVDDALHFAGLQGPIEDVQHRAFALLHVEDGNSGERPPVGGLTAAFRVERAAVEDHCRPSAQVAHGEDPAGKPRQIGIVQIEALGHGTRF